MSVTPARPAIVITEVTQNKCIYYIFQMYHYSINVRYSKVEAMVFDGKIAFVYCLFFGFVTLQFTYLTGLGHWVLSVLYANGFKIFYYLVKEKNLI